MELLTALPFTQAPSTRSAESAELKPQRTGPPERQPPDSREKPARTRPRGTGRTAVEGEQAKQAIEALVWLRSNTGHAYFPKLLRRKTFR